MDKKLIEWYYNRLQHIVEVFHKQYHGNYGGCGMMAIHICDYLERIGMDCSVIAFKKVHNNEFVDFKFAEAEHYGISFYDKIINPPGFKNYITQIKSAKDCREIIYLKNGGMYNHKYDTTFIKMLYS